MAAAWCGAFFFVIFGKYSKDDTNDIDTTTIYMKNILLQLTKYIIDFKRILLLAIFIMNFKFSSFKFTLPLQFTIQVNLVYARYYFN